MSSRCHIHLPVDVRAHEAGEVIGILAGLKSHKKFFESGKGWYAEVRGVSEHGNPTNIGFGEIMFGGDMVDGENAHSVYFHYSTRLYGGVYNMVSCASTPFWCAVGLRMVQFFGGVCVYNDCDDTKKAGCFKRRCPQDRNGFIPEIGNKWFEYQQALLDMKPLSKTEIEDARAFAAYKDK